MKKTVLAFGLISGAIASLLMFGTLPFAYRIGFDKALFVGYTTIVASLLPVFFGIRSYRENVGGGTITFGRAFAVGILITLISCAFYVITWEIMYYTFMGDFCDRYANYLFEKARASGTSLQVVEAKVQQLKRILGNPFLNAAVTFTEPFPIGLVITLISSAILRKK